MNELRESEATVSLKALKTGCVPTRWISEQSIYGLAALARIYSIHLKRSIESSFASHLIRIKAAWIFLDSTGAHFAF
jgi:hypothetical protein